MTGFLLDTNIISEIRKPKPHGAVWSWFQQLRPDRMFLSAVTLGELQKGVEITRRQDKAKATDIERWIDRIEASYSVLPMDGPCFREYARLMQGVSDTLSEDAMIAATARVHGLTVANATNVTFETWMSPSSILSRVNRPTESARTHKPIDITTSSKPLVSTGIQL